MMVCHELFGFMPNELASEILEYAYASDKQAYRVALAAVAEARRVRPLFLERKPRVERHKDMLDMLSRPRMEAIAADLLRSWLVKSQGAMLSQFLDAMGISHKEGVVEEFPESVDDAKLASAIDGLLDQYAAPKVIVYLHALCATNDGGWENLRERLQKDPRLQLS